MPKLPRDPFTAADARAAGYSRSDRDHRLEAGQWVRLARGVYCSRGLFEAAGTDADRYSLNVRAAQLAIPRLAVGSPWTAAYLQGLPTPTGWRPARISLTSVRGSDRANGVARISVGPLRPYDLEVVRNVTCTSPLRTALDLAIRPGPGHAPDALAVLDQVLRRGVSAPSLTAGLDQFASWPGVEGARRLVSMANPLSESWLESASRL